jgi:two-component system chemotaxis response regulator CheY
MKPINLTGLSFLIADPSHYSSLIASGILRAFGARRVLEVDRARDAMTALVEHNVDMLLCDPLLPPGGGLQFIRSLRWSPDSPCRRLPIMVTTGDTRMSVIMEARDNGANMVVAKPMSPLALYRRLSWLVFNPRKFIDASTYCGPDRRFAIEDFAGGVGRRKDDKAVEVGENTGPALSQSEIDNLLQAARSGVGA